MNHHLSQVGQDYALAIFAIILCGLIVLIAAGVL